MDPSNNCLSSPLVNHLPHEIVTHICSYLEQPHHVASVSKTWKKACEFFLTERFKSANFSSFNEYFEIKKGCKLETLKKIEYIFNQIKIKKEYFASEKFNPKAFLPIHRLEEIAMWVVNRDKEEKACELIRCFEEIAFSHNVVRQLIKDLSPDLTPLSKAEAIREWIKDNLTVLEQIKHLNLSGLDLKNLPQEIKSFSQVTELNLTCNKLKILPVEIASLTKLIKLHLGYNKLKSLPVEIKNLKKLKNLNLNYNQLTSFPKVIRTFSKLKVLSLIENPFECLPAEIAKYHKLEYVETSYHCLYNLPSEIRKKFEVRGNKLVRKDCLNRYSPTL